MPLDQSAAYILGLFQKKKTAFWALLGEMKKIRGEQKKQKVHQILVHFLGGHFNYKIGLKMRFLAKMLAADRSLTYVYAGEALGCPHFGLQRGIRLATLKGNRLSTFLGAIFAL